MASIEAEAAKKNRESKKHQHIARQRKIARYKYDNKIFFVNHICGWLPINNDLTEKL